MGKRKLKIQELKQKLELRCQELESERRNNLTMQMYVQHRTDSQQKACELWRKETGNQIGWPDAADLMYWLMEENASLRKQNQALMAEITPKLDPVETDQYMRENWPDLWDRVRGVKKNDN